MKRHNLIYWILVAIFIALATTIWLLPDQKTSQTHQPLTSLDPQAINQIRLSNNNGPSFELLRVGPKWQMKSPYQIDANTPRIDILLDLVSTPSLEQFDLPSGDLKQFGLDKPQATVEFNETKLIIGGTHPYNYRRYIKIGNQLHLTKDAFPHHLLALAEDFVSHGIFLPEEQIVGVKSDQWEIRQRELGQWEITPPVKSLDSTYLANKIEEWNHSWAEKVIEIPTEHITQKIELTLAGRTPPLTIEVISKKKELIVIRRDRGVAYRLPAASIFHLPKVR